ncbi:Fur family transcriptional regulator [Nocardia nova]|uniref:Fur family transcriptional regulator n=1 Tax=Nocardia nova TaxID=37330 RepID=UPI0004B58239|nr:transcriptional repressor [Nocardia nova]
MRTRIVLDILESDDRFWTRQQLYDELRATGVPIASSTVYRILHKLDEMRQVETMLSEDGEMLYRLGKPEGHHHNLVCRRCGYAERFTLGAIDRHAHHLGHRFEYTDIECRFDIYGMCHTCRNTPEYH